MFFSFSRFSKRFFLISILSLIFSTKIFAIGAGAQISLIPTMYFGNEKVNFSSLEYNATGTIRLMRFPVVFGIGLEGASYNNNFSFGISAFADYWLIDKQIYNNWNWYLAAGLSGKFMTSVESENSLNGAVRAVVGVNCLLLDNYIEIYAQGVTAPGITKDFETSSTYFNISFPIEIGARVHF